MITQVHTERNAFQRWLRPVLAGLLLAALSLQALSAGAAAQDIYEVRIQVDVRNTSLKELFAIIEDRTDFTFTYSSRKIDLAQRLTLHENYQNLCVLLEAVAAQANVQIKQLDELLLVKAAPIVARQPARVGVVRGRVFDDQLKTTLPGATVYQRGTSNGTTTDVNGEFTLRVPAGEVEMEVTYIGYRTYSEMVSVPEEGNVQVDFKMVSDITQLQFVTVTGVLQGQQRALNQQKTADNIRNVVSADQIGRFPVFEGDSLRAPMGIALYTEPATGTIYAIVGRKTGPTNGTYLWQYKLQDNGRGTVAGTLVRKVGVYSGKNEIESIAVDNELGYLYCSDEGVGVCKYYAHPDSATRELALFATTGFTDNHEGISIYKQEGGKGYILVSDQQANRFHIFPREGTGSNPHDHPLLHIVNTSTLESDGSDVTSTPLPGFPQGLFVAMSDDKTFQFYRWQDLWPAK
jgi:hypothetical protein